MRAQVPGLRNAPGLCNARAAGATPLKITAFDRPDLTLAVDRRPRLWTANVRCRETRCRRRDRGWEIEPKIGPEQPRPSAKMPAPPWKPAAYAAEMAATEVTAAKMAAAAKVATSATMAAAATVATAVRLFLRIDRA